MYTVALRAKAPGRAALYWGGVNFAGKEGEINFGLGIFGFGALRARRAWRAARELWLIWGGEEMQPRNRGGAGMDAEREWEARVAAIYARLPQ
jgi:hypothetical protein